MKTYSTKANARRAAKHELGESAIEGQHYQLVEVGEEIGFRPMAGNAIAASDVAEAGEQVTPQLTASAEDGAPATEQEPQAAGGKRNRSTVESPVKQVWAIADSMVGTSRKNIIAACIEQGIAFYTARTQYQRWRASKL